MTPAESDSENEAVRDDSQPGDDQHGGAWNPYQASWTAPGPVIEQTQSVSVLSIMSMMFGVVSVPLICLCFFSIPFSLLAIVSGHISRSICRRSQGRVTGDGMAVAGLVLGYLSLLVTTGMLTFWFATISIAPRGVPAPPAPVIALRDLPQSDAEEELNQAIAMASLSLSAGNSDEATKLAQHLQASLNDLAQQLHVGSSAAEDGDAATAEPGSAGARRTTAQAIIAELSDDPGTSAMQKSLTGCGVYCELHTTSCAFLVTISNHSDLNDADRTALSDVIWFAAARSLDHHLGEGEKFALALVSDGELREISLGHFERSELFNAGLQHRSPANDGQRLALAEFFERDDAESVPGSVE